MSKKNKSDKKSLDVQVKKALISSVSAVVCVAITVAAALNCTNTVTGNRLEKAKLRTPSGGAVVSQQEDYNQNGGFSEPTADTPTDETAAVTDTQASESNVQAQSGESAPASSGSTAAQPSGTAQSGSNASSSPLPTKAAQLNYFNTAVNKIKSQKVGYTKHHVMEVKGNVDGIPSWLVGLVTKDKTTTMAKGADNTDDFPVGGYNWVSKLTMNDIKDITFKQSGDNYEFYITLGQEKNPSKGNSSYGRIFSVIDANGAAEMVGGALKSITMMYHDGYAKAVINSKTGRVISAEFSATADIEANIMLVGDISAKDIISTESYTDFKY
ncbi:MAG: hypothetical protein ACI4XH_10260 [Acutalibacteraceae bacterium]